MPAKLVLVQKMKANSLYILFILLFYSKSYSQINWYDNLEINNFKETKYVSIAFATQDLKSVTSTFGHTFVIFHNDKTPSLYDHTVEFKGIINPSFNGYIHALLGEIKGKVELNNLIYKKREYHQEGRDIWMYRLLLTDEEIKNLVTILKNGILKPPRYSFLSGNCGEYLVTALMQATKRERQKKIINIPTQLMIGLGEMKLIDTTSSKIFPATYNQTNQVIQTLPIKKKEELYRFYYKNEESFKPENDLEKSLFSEIIITKAENTFDRDRRNELFNKKKIYQNQKTLPYQAVDPLKYPGDSFISASKSINLEGAYRLHFRPAQRSFISIPNDNFRFSKLEVTKFSLRSNKNKIILDEFNLLNMESVLENNFFSNDLDKHIDLSFYNWSLVGYNTKETTFRFGLGESFLNSNLCLTLFPYLGVRRISQFNRNFFKSDQGIKLIAQLKSSDNILIRFSLNQYILSPLPFSKIVEIESSYRINPSITIFYRYQTSEFLSQNNNFNEIGLAYLF